MSQPGAFLLHQDLESGIWSETEIPKRMLSLASDSKRICVRLDDGTQVFFESGSRLPSSNPSFSGVLSGASWLGTGNRPVWVNAFGQLLVAEVPDFLSAIGAIALGETSSTAYRGDRGKTAYEHSLVTDANPHGTTAAQVGALPQITLPGAVDFNNIYGGLPCVAAVSGTTYTNSPWPSPSAADECSLIQLVSKAGRRTQMIIDNHFGTMAIRSQPTFLGVGIWSPWDWQWGEYSLPVSTWAKTLLDDTSASAARSTLGAAPSYGAEVLVHSDFGRIATVTGGQSAFTNNTAGGLQLAANSISNGTKIVVESLCVIPADVGGSVQVSIGPQLTGEQSPTYPLYSDALSPGSGAGQAWGAGILRIEIEFLGFSQNITAYITASFQASGQAPAVVRVGEIPVDGTQARTLDLRFNPYANTNYVFRRNRVLRRNP